MALIAHYRLDGDASDAAGNNHGVASNVTWVDGKLGSAGKFNGINSVVDTGLKIEDFVGDMSIAGWIGSADLSARNPILGVATSGVKPQLSVDGVEGSVNVMFHNEGNEYYASSEAFAYISSKPADSFSHVCSLKEGETVRLFVDGLEFALTSLGPGSKYANNGFLTIGKGYRSGAIRHADAVIDDVRIYDHALSPREVRDLSLGLVSHFPMLSDEWGSHGTSSPVVVNAALSEEGGFEFTGADSYIDLGSDQNFVGKADNSPLTVCAWIKPSKFSTRDMILSKNPNRSTKNYTYMFGLVSGNMNAYTGSTWRAFSTSGLISIGKWTHVAWVFDGTTLKGYVNGELVGSRSDFTYTNKEPSTVKIGGYHTNSDFHGIIKDHRVYSNPLTGEQIKELAQQRASIDSKGSMHTVLTEHDLASNKKIEVYGHRTSSRTRVNGTIVDYRDRGLNATILSPSGKVVSRGNFDTYARNRYRIDGPFVSCTAAEMFEAMLGFLKKAEHGEYLCLSVFDTSDKKNSQVGEFLSSLGIKTYFDVAYRDGWAVITRVGSGYAAEDINKYNSGVIASVEWPLVMETGLHQIGAKTPSATEVGVTRGLVAWYPLIGDTKDYAGTNHATNNGAVATAEGYEFDGATNYLLIEPTTVDASVDFTLSFWVYLRGTSTYTLYCARTSLGNGLSIFGLNGKIRFDLGNQWTTTVAPPLNEWSHVTVSREGDSKFIFFNGVLVESTSIGALTNFNPNLSTVGASQVNGSNYANYIDGIIRDFRSFDKSLAEEEVAILYNLTNPAGSKTAMTDDYLYVKGQIKEVIA